MFAGDADVWAAHWSIPGLAEADLRSTDIPTNSNWYLKDEIRRIEMKKQTDNIYRTTAWNPKLLETDKWYSVAGEFSHMLTQ